jgi:hypothetical protein
MADPKARRPKGSFALYKRGALYVAQADLGRKPNGQRDRPMRSGRTKADALKRLNAHLA